MNLPMGDVHRGISPQITLAVNTRKVLKKDQKLCKELRHCTHYVRIVNVASPTTGRRPIAISFSGSAHDRNVK